MQDLPHEPPRSSRPRGRAWHVAVAFLAIAAVVLGLDQLGGSAPPPRPAALRFAEQELRRELVRNRLQLAEPRPGTLELRLPALVGRDVAGTGPRVDTAAVRGIARRVLEVYAPDRARASVRVDSVVVVLQGRTGWLGLVGGSRPTVHAFDAESLRPPALEPAVETAGDFPAARP